MYWFYDQIPFGCISCITPPHVLERIAERGSAAQKTRARSTLDLDDIIRRQRIRQSTLRRPARALRRFQRLLQSPELAGSAVCAEKRTIFDAKQGQRLPGSKVRSEGQAPTGDPAVDEAYEGLGHTFDLYEDVYERCSIDDEGMPLLASVHFKKGYDNAFWNSRQMVFGDGDEDLPPAQRIFNRFTISLDVIGHELTHGVTEHESGLLYVGQAGALNESMSDVFGSLVKQKHLNQTASQADWLIGAELLTNNVTGVALRSMKDPGNAFDDPVLGKDDQPAHMSDYVRTFQDNGGVHINSGIPNKAFFLAATNIGGYAWQKAGLVWYETNRSPALRPFTLFATFANLTITVAGQLFGAGGTEQKAIEDAWQQVGVIA